MAPVTKRRRAVVEEAESDPDVQSEEEAPQNTQRRHRQVASDTDPEEDTYNGEDMDIDGAVEEGGASDEDQLVKKFVRYALACEYARLPIRREGVRDKVFGKNKASWKKVFDSTQFQLKQKFGMEMVELPLKEKVTLKDRLAASKSQSAPTSSKSWVLTSTLPSTYRTPAILPPSRIPTPSIEGSYIGLYSLIITLISLSGGKLADAKLNSYLQRLNADVNTPMDKTEAVLARMIKHGYLTRLRDSTGGEDIVEWMVGPRGRIEVGAAGVTGLVTLAYGDAAPPDLHDRIASSLGRDGPKQEPAALDKGGEKSQPAAPARPNGRRTRRAAAGAGETDGEDD